MDWRGGGRAPHSRQGHSQRPYSGFGHRSRTDTTPVSIPLTPSSAASSAASSATSSAASSASSAAAFNTSSKHSWQESADGFRHPPQKYVSKFKKSSEKVEDTILNTILLGKLNKFSQPNYGVYYAYYRQWPNRYD